jgi:hypothetical protein
MRMLANDLDQRFIVKFVLPGFETYVEVFGDFSCKSYYTVYDPMTADKSLEDLEYEAEEAAMDKYIEHYNGGKL